ncbi:MAG: hypothetical protein RSE01_09015 [Akkermansia sp.]
MKIIIKETQEIVDLTLIDLETGLSQTEDILGNAEAFREGQIEKNEEGEYTCDQACYDWWREIFEEESALMQRVASLELDHDRDDIDEVLSAAEGTDLENHADVANYLLDCAFGKQ